MTLKFEKNDNALIQSFYQLHNIEDVAELLEINSGILNYYIYKLPPNNRYTPIKIKKKFGGIREILIPNDSLKIIQQKLNYILQLVYPTKATVHGFVKGRSIYTNALVHIKKKNIFNLDLSDFFPSINFGRVRGMFIKIPYDLNPKAATVLAQICCFDNVLPQGAPTSPIISNMICSKLDSELRRFAEEQKCFYTRYADDITISTTRSKFPSEIAIGVDGTVVVGDQLRTIIEQNGFSINNKKVRQRTKKTRQEVTGLTVNQFPNVQRKYVRQIQSMLHAWANHGLEAAQQTFWDKYDKKHRPPFNKYPLFKNVVKGKIDYLNMVRGKDDSIYLKLIRKYAALDPDYDYKPPKSATKSDKIVLPPRIMAEGKTDWKHLKSALKKLQDQGLFTTLNIEFHEDEVDMGDGELYKFCVARSKTREDRKLICIFDRDKPEIIKKASDNSTEHNYKNWGNNVYSFVLPIPEHRQDNPEICIEFYYTDAEIKHEDSMGRRLFIGNEFKESTWHENGDLVCRARNKVGKANAIIDSDVFNRNEENVALSKAAFADYILKGDEKFKDFDVSEFKKIFQIIESISESV